MKIQENRFISEPVIPFRTATLASESTTGLNLPLDVEVSAIAIPSNINE